MSQSPFTQRPPLTCASWPCPHPQSFATITSAFLTMCVLLLLPALDALQALKNFNAPSSFPLPVAAPAPNSGMLIKTGYWTWARCARRTTLCPPLCWPWHTRLLWWVGPVGVGAGALGAALYRRYLAIAPSSVMPVLTSPLLQSGHGDREHAHWCAVAGGMLSQANLHSVRQPWHSLPALHHPSAACPRPRRPHGQRPGESGCGGGAGHVLR